MLAGRNQRLADLTLAANRAWAFRRLRVLRLVRDSGSEPGSGREGYLGHRAGAAGGHNGDRHRRSRHHLAPLLSAAASFGVLTAFFQWGWGTRAFGLGTPTPVEGYLPGFVLAILFGLSMDYQVFLVSRTAEEWSRTRDNARSVLVGQTHTARVITAAAAIMIAVFITFSCSSARSTSPSSASG
jgi:uncharacterized membrane protein YdfJ with MMPL/SSD domain